MFAKLAYPMARAALFRLDPELAHDVALGSLKKAERLHTIKLFASRVPEKPTTVMGLEFPNPCGLAAGLDKNGDYIDALGALGFGSIEIGTITPKPQAGNPKPRMFRLASDSALINRLGFNNKGVDYLCQRVKKRRYRGILGINIGKNKATPNERAVDDYIHCLRKVYPLADYVTVNISSPNTEGLRDLQHADSLRTLLQDLKSEQDQLRQVHDRTVPLVVKLAPDLDDAARDQTVAVLNSIAPEGVIMGNTTISRPSLGDLRHAQESGGLSGKPLLPLANDQLGKLRQQLSSSIPIVGVGGITSAEAAAQKFTLGAALVQIYTGFIYAGPDLIRQVVQRAPEL